MTGAQDSTDRAGRCVRRIARVLAVIWAVYWTLWHGFVLSGLWRSWGLVPATYKPMLDASILAAWAAVAITWRWERAGAVLLVSASLLLPASEYFHGQYIWESIWLQRFVASPLVPLVLASVAASLVFHRAGRKANGMRSSGRALALIWAGSWTVSHLWLVHWMRHFASVPYWLAVGASTVASWAVAVTPWRWERLGAVLLLAATVALPASGYAGLLLLSLPEGTGVAMVIVFATWFVGLVAMGLLGSAAATLFLFSWRKSRTSGSPPEHECVSMSPIMWETSSEDGQNGQGSRTSAHS